MMGQTILSTKCSGSWKGTWDQEFLFCFFGKMGEIAVSSLMGMPQERERERGN